MHTTSTWDLSMALMCVPCRSAQTERRWTDNVPSRADRYFHLDAMEAAVPVGDEVELGVLRGGEQHDEAVLDQVCMCLGCAEISLVLGVVDPHPRTLGAMRHRAVAT
jgi:hypothetical protein